MIVWPKLANAGPTTLRYVVLIYGDPLAGALGTGQTILLTKREGCICTRSVQLCF